MIKIKLFRQKCIGCNYCVEIAPDYWEMDWSDGKCNLVGSDLIKGIYERITINEDIEILNDCMLNCPVKAIKIDNIK